MVSILYDSMNMLNQSKNNKLMNVDCCSLERLYCIFHCKQHTPTPLYRQTYFIYNYNNNKSKNEDSIRT